MFRTPAPPKKPETGTIRAGAQRLPYVVIRSAKRRRSIGFRVDAEHGIVVRAPVRASLGAIEKVLAARASWLLKHFTRLRQNPPLKPSERFAPGKPIPYLGTPLTLEVSADPRRARASCAREGDTLRVKVKAATRPQIEAAVKAWFYRQGQTVFAERTEAWSRRMKLVPRRILVSNPRRRWASCSADNTLRFSWRLLMTPLELLDYVVVHELAHVKEKNHGPKFWALVEKQVPDYRAKRKALNDLGLTLP